MSTIPISQVVQILPGVIAGGGTPSKLSGMVLTQDTSVPPSQIKTFFTKEDVQAWFGPASPEAVMANMYFPGIVNGGQLPYELKFARNVLAAAPAGVYGIDLGALTLAQLNTFSGTLIVTLGSEGVAAWSGDDELRVPGLRVDAVDSTGAGDCFVGYLAAGLVEGEELAAAIDLANKAAALSVTRHGAASSIPTRAEVGQ